MASIDDLKATIGKFTKGKNLTEVNTSTSSQPIFSRIDQMSKDKVSRPSPKKQSAGMTRSNTTTEQLINRQTKVKDFDPSDYPNISPQPAEASPTTVGNPFSVYTSGIRLASDYNYDTPTTTPSLLSGGVSSVGNPKKPSMSKSTKMDIASSSLSVGAGVAASGAALAIGIGVLNTELMFKQLGVASNIVSLINNSSSMMQQLNSTSAAKQASIATGDTASGIQSQLVALDEMQQGSAKIGDMKNKVFEQLTSASANRFSAMLGMWGNVSGFISGASTGIVGGMSSYDAITRDIGIQQATNVQKNTVIKTKTYGG